MNEETAAARPKGLEEVPLTFRSPAPTEGTERPPCRPEDLAGQDLRGQDLTAIEGLLPEHLAGADLTGAKLPDEIAKFPALEQVKAISGEARKVFIGLLAACVYSWLVIGTTKDVDLILNTVSSPLPIINTPIPIAGFYVVGAALLAAVYCYFHFYLQRLWRTLASLPAVFQEGTALDDRTDPWLLTNLVRADFQRLQQNAPPLTRLENLLAILLAWWLVPLTLLALWARYLPAHYWLGTTWLVALIGITVLFGRHSYRLAGATLRGEMPAAAAEDDDGRGVPRRAWYEFRQIRSDQLTVGLTAVLIVCSLSAFRDNPRDAHTWVAKGLNFVGIRTYANLREVNVAEPPDVWDGKDWSKVKRRDLRGRNLAFADGAGAFLANTDLRGANLTGADLSGAQLQGADLGRAQLQGVELSDTQLQDTELGRAQLQGADLGRARLQGANISLAKLQGANLSGAELQGANLSGAELQGADLGLAERRARAGLIFISAETAFFRPAQLQGADLRAARLEGANLSGAELQGAYLRGAWLQGTDLSYAQLQAADLHYASIWRARVNDTLWDLADLGGSTVQPITDSEIDALIGEAIKSIPDEERRKEAAERLNTGLRTADRPAKPDLEWRSKPYVMFDQVPFLRQALRQIEQAYDEDLATYLGDLACASDVPEAQTRGLARRALDDANRARPFAQRLAARVIGSDCPPAKGLADDMRRQLEQLAARGAPAGASPETAPPDALK